jgi:hypothetical protein
MRWTNEASRCAGLDAEATMLGTIRLLHHVYSLKTKLAAP